MSALKELTNPANWETEEQWMDGTPLGYSEVFYVGDPVFIEAAKEFEDLEAQLKQIEANYDALQTPMPCGHLARYAVISESNPHAITTQYCALCALEADKQTIANLVMVDVEEPENEKCPFCQTRAILTRVGELLDLTPEIGSPHYDDVIADLINDTSSANSTFQCYCEENHHE